MTQVIKPIKIIETQVDRSERYGVTEYTKTHGHREVGSLIRTFEVEYKTVESAFGRQGKIDTNAIHGLWVSATRDEICYGGTQPVRYFASVKERDAAIKKYISGARSRAIRKFS